MGSEGTGNLYLTNGGKASNVIGSIGNNALGDGGYANVSGTGSTWTNTGALLVGNATSGYLGIANGGVVTSTAGHIGELAGVGGSVRIDGAGSQWSLSGDLYIGNGGSGTLWLINQGRIGRRRRTGTVNLAHSSGSSGELNIGYDEGYFTGMILNAAQITTGAGNDGTVNFGTTATSAAPFYLTKDGTPAGPPCSSPARPKFITRPATTS